jgi:polysaccharidase protein
MSRTFYVDSRTGSDTNAGSATAPWASVDRVNSAGLQPGDTVLFARGASFDGVITLNESGAAGAPISFGAYGKGDAPVITGGAEGVSGWGHDHIVVRDLHITNKSGAGVISFGSTDWVIDNVDVDNVGNGYIPGNNAFSAFQFRDVSGLTIQNSSYKDVVGDGVFLWDASGVKILNNHFDTPSGPTSDNVHTYRMSDYEIRGNTMSFAGETDSGKGNMIVQESKNGVIAENTFILDHAHYGIGGTIQNGVVENNHFIGRAEGTWSVGLNVTETLGSPSYVENMAVRNNFFEGVGTGIYTWDGNGAGTAHRNNFNVTGNIFKDLRDPALVSEGEIELNGSYANNTLINSDDPNLGGTAGNWSVASNVHAADASAVSGRLGAMGAAASGPVVTASEVFAPPPPPAAAEPVVAKPAPAPTPAVAPAPVVPKIVADPEWWVAAGSAI